MDTWGAGLEEPQYLERGGFYDKNILGKSFSPRCESSKVGRAESVNDLHVVPIADSPVIAVNVESLEPEL